MPHGKHRSVDPTRFAMVPRNDVRRSAFDMSHTHKTSFNAGLLVPVFVMDVLPGDSIRLGMTAFARLATPIVPVMDNLYLESFFFFVPNRLVWENWARFMGERASPTDTTSFLVPYMPIVAADCVIGGMVDYFGITVNNGAGSVLVNALPFRGYNLIWNEFFRDEDLQTPATVTTGDGPDSNIYVLQRRGKRHDYFTSARPWPQKPLNVDIQSSLLMGDLVPGQRMRRPEAGAPVSGFGVLAAEVPTTGPTTFRESGGRSVAYAEHYGTDTDTFFMRADPTTDFPDVRVLINDIRTANSVQLLLEKNARGGTRYTELVRAHFGVVSPDARLQRPEFLGGGRANVTVNPVAQTSASGATGTSTVLGELAGIGTAIASNHGFSSSFTEHGFIIGLISVRADLTYQQGINRMWFRRTQYDHFWPSLENLGEQPILSKEIYCDGDSANDDSVFGYQERWSEYKYLPSRISGAFRSSTATPLDMWHFAQQFSSRPLLNANFIQEAPPVDRVLQVETNDGEEFLLDAMFNIRAVRPMAMHSIPGLGGRL